MVPQPLVVEDERANRIRQLVTLPTALLPSGILACSFRRSGARSLDRVGSCTKLVGGDMCHYRCLPSRIRGKTRRST